MADGTLTERDFICDECGAICAMNPKGAVVMEEQQMPNGERYPRQVGEICEVCMGKALVSDATA